jgi:hypothetical protein
MLQVPAYIRSKGIARSPSGLACDADLTIRSKHKREKVNDKLASGLQP